MPYRLFTRLTIPLKDILLRIPRKGCKRFLLVVILAFTGYKIAGALLTPAGYPLRGEKITSVPGFETAAAFVSRFQPRLTCCRDTFITDGRTVVACYSLDTAVQNGIDRMIKHYRPNYGAAVVMDPESGRILALVSYRNESVPAIGERLYLRSIFPAASIYKTVTAAAAIETAQYGPQTMVHVTGRNHTLYKFQLKKSSASWNERTFEDAFAYSINPVFARIGMYDVGKKPFERYSRQFGFNEAIPFDLAVDSSRVTVPDDTSYAMAELASGFNRGTTLSPVHGALIAAAVSENGRMPVPHIVDSIYCINDGRCLYRQTPALWKNSMNNNTAHELRNMMNRVAMLGTCRKAFKVLRNCAWSEDLDYGGKTGSLVVDSLGKIDWFIGFAASKNQPGRRLAVAVVTVHGRLWNVHSSFVGAEIFRKYFRPAPVLQLAGQNSVPASGPAACRPGG
jgi:penicillin-binding protein A